MKRDIRVSILMAVMILRKTSSLSIDLTHQKHCIMTWFALLTLTGVGTNLLFPHFLLSTHSLWEAKTFSQFIIHQLLDVQLCVWEVCGIHPCANKERKSCTTASPMFRHFKTLLARLCPSEYFHFCIIPGESVYFS